MSYRNGLRVGYAGSTGTSIIDEAGFCVATVFPPDMKDGRNYDTDTAMADAFMFVAAGPLLEALEGILAAWSATLGSAPRSVFFAFPSVFAARAAIALAKGEKP